jgi:RHS repeat-associated protein
VQELDVNMGAHPLVIEGRHDKHYGVFTLHDETTGLLTTQVTLRKIPGPDGFLATRHGAGGKWVFTFGEERGTRFVTDDGGAFVQDINYRPFGKPTSTGAQPGSPLYSNEQWNQGDYLAAFGISQLGARLYDPAIGRFLSRDPLLIPRTAATTNPYAFAYNDPVNKNDPSGLVVGEIYDEDDGVPKKNEDHSTFDGNSHTFGGDGFDLPSAGATTQLPSDSQITLIGVGGSDSNGSGSSEGNRTSSPVSTGTILASQPTLPVAAAAAPPTTALPPLPNSPGQQPLQLYIGRIAHQEIAFAYRAAHPTDTVFANYFPVRTILGAFPNAQLSGVNPGFAGWMPDIVNVTTGEIYEIKPVYSAGQAFVELQIYLAIFRAAGVTLTPGSPLAPGTAGIIPAPGGFFSFGSPMPGVITYEYIPTMIPPFPVRVPVRVPVPAPSPTFWQRMSAATGLSGAALAIYLVFSEGTRVIPCAI